MTSRNTGCFTASFAVLLAGIALVGPTQAATIAAKDAAGHTTTAATSRTASLAMPGSSGVVVKIGGALLEEMDTAFPDSHIERIRDAAPEQYEAVMQTAPARICKR